MMFVICQPPSSALPMPLWAHFFSLPNGSSYRTDDTTRCRVSKIEWPHSHPDFTLSAAQLLFCGNNWSPLSVRMPLPLSIDSDSVYPTSADNPPLRRRVSFAVSELYRASATLPIV